MAEEQRTYLIETIKRAFKQTPFPGRKIGDKEELAEFLGKTWNEVSVQDINRNYSLLFFNRKGLQYYLPAYLITILEQPDKIVSHVRETIIRELGVEPIDEDLCGYFTKEQRLAILAFFENYEYFFPYPLPDDLTEAQLRLAKRKKDNHDIQVEAAIKYWKGCT